MTLILMPLCPSIIYLPYFCFGCHLKTAPKPSLLKHYHHTIPAKAANKENISTSKDSFNKNCTRRESNVQWLWDWRRNWKLRFFRDSRHQNIERKIAVFVVWRCYFEICSQNQLLAFEPLKTLFSLSFNCLLSRGCTACNALRKFQGHMPSSCWEVHSD